MARDNAWLSLELESIWRRWFVDVERLTPVSIQFVRPWKRRLAVIYLTEDEAQSFIGISRYLRDERVPYTVCQVTIAHELVHYAHGFGSHHPRRYRHPHRGNVVQRELTQRGLGAELGIYNDWTTNCWFDLLPELAAGPRLGTADPAASHMPRAAAQVLPLPLGEGRGEGSRQAR